MLANQRRHSRPETHVRSGGREFGEFAVQRLSQVSGALGTPRAGGWRQAESRTHSPCRGTWGLRGSQQPWGAGGRLRGRGAPGVRCPEPRCARPGGARCLGPGPHPAPRRGRGAAATAPCRALSSWRSPNSAATQPARPGVRGTRGKSASRCPPWEWNGASWVLTLPLPQPPASRVRLTRAGARPPAVLSLAKKRVSVPAFAPPPFGPCSPPGATCAEPEARLRLRIAPGFVRMRLGLNCHQLKEAVAATGRLFFQ